MVKDLKIKDIGNNNVSLSFKYDKSFINQIKDLNFRYYEPDNKSWVTSKEQAKWLLEANNIEIPSFLNDFDYGFEFVEINQFIKDVGIKGQIIVRFNFSKEVVNFIKNECEFRRWIPSEKAWVVNKNDAKAICSKFNIELPNFLKNNSNKIAIVIDGNKFYYEGQEPSLKNNPAFSRLNYIKQAKDIFKVCEILKDNGYKSISIKGFKPINKSVEFKPIDSLKLYPYQRDCVDSFHYKFKNSGIMALDMGLGKTITSLMTFFASDAKNLLIVAPNNLLEQWKITIEDFFGYNEAIIIDSKTKKSDRIKLFNESPCIITSFDILRIEDPQLHIDMIIIDEVQKIKNWKTKRAKALSNIVARYRIGLTGTPIENHLEELFNIAEQCVPGYFGSLKSFQDKYINYEYFVDSWGREFKKIIGYKNLEDIYIKMKDLMFRKTKEDVAEELPERIMMTRSCIMSSDEKRAYKILSTRNEDEEKRLGDIANMKVFASNSNMKMQNEDFSSKEKLLEELLTDELQTREKIIVFTQFKKNLYGFRKIAEKHKNEFKAIFLSGDNSKDIEKIKKQFIDYPGRLVLFMTDVGQYGTDGLQIADVLINFDLTWNPAKLEQRIGRIHRLGSKHNKILILNLITKGTIDDYIIHILNSKSDLASLSIDGVKAYILNKVYKGD